MLTSRNSLFSAVVGAMAVGKVAADASIIDNTITAAYVKTNAVKLVGNYTITNPATGHTLVYLHDQHHNIVPMSTSELKKQKAKQDSSSGESMGFLATDVFTLIDEGDSDGAVLIANTELGKAMGAAWGGSEDKWGVPYAYGDDSNRWYAPYKYLWYFVPCGSDAGSSSGSSGSRSSASVSAGISISIGDEHDDGSGCTKPATWLDRHDSYIKKHKECAKRLKDYRKGTAIGAQGDRDGDGMDDKDPSQRWNGPKAEKGFEKSSSHKSHKSAKHAKHHKQEKKGCRAKRGLDGEEIEQTLEARMMDLEFADESNLVKRGSKGSKGSKSDGEYCIIAQDHILDMTTKALAAKKLSAFDSMDGTELSDWDEKNVLDTQIWKVVSA